MTAGRSFILGMLTASVLLGVAPAMGWNAVNSAIALAAVALIASAVGKMVSR